MMLDAQACFSDMQDLAKTAAAYLSDNSYDLGAAGTNDMGHTVLKDVGRGQAPEILIQVTETFTSGGAATVAFALVQADNEALDSNLQVLQDTGAIGYATLVAGYKVRLRVPHGVTKRYLGVRYTVATATTTAGKVTAGFITAMDQNPTVLS